MLQPAHHTKHVPLLNVSFRTHTFILAQADDGAANGTALWLSGQVLAAYLASLSPKPGRRAIELGSGIGFTALVLASLGYDVLATDADPAVLALLRQNVQLNAANLPGSVTVRELDWCVLPEQWDWDHPSTITGSNNAQPTHPPFDLVITADTFYTPRLTPHLVRTLQALTRATPTDVPSDLPKPTTYVALERREPEVIDSALGQIPGTLTRIPHKKLIKAMHALGWKWDATEWEGVEVWKVKWE